jgi:transcriptional regulator with PAS, ATPase and Fis domain
VVLVKRTSPSRPINVVIEPVMVSRAMQAIHRTLAHVANKDVVICLVGESGTGKEVLARRIHDLSERRAERFVPINCAAIPEPLFESELFGHERGAFTGANQLARGKVEVASRGSLFLDEIGELSLPAQAKLLRFLESWRFMRVGGTEKLFADVRLICATLRPLDEEVRRQAFRPDLFYRIQGITLQLPPLRERRADILPLIRVLTAELTRKHRVPPPQLTRSATAALREYSWPGNVRELRNVMEQLCLLRGGRTVRAADLPAALQSRSHPSTGEAPSASLQVRLDQPLDDTIDLIIEKAVALQAGNRTLAARRLGIGLRTVQRRMRGRG